jgi:hypothetical protein
VTDTSGGGIVIGPSAQPEGSRGDDVDDGAPSNNKPKPRPKPSGDDAETSDSGDADSGDAGDSGDTGDSGDADSGDAGDSGDTGDSGDADDGGPTPQQHVWTFDNPGDYAFDANTVSIASGSASLRLIDQLDDADEATGFGGGVKADTAWVDAATDHLALDGAGLLAGTGTYTSRVMDAGGDVAWESLSWTPLAPYGKQLPDDGDTETAYANDNVAMTGNMALLHFNESSWGGAGSIADTSGGARPGTPAGNAAPGGAGVFGGAAALDGNGDYIDVATPGVGATADLTYTIWVKFNAFDANGGANDGNGDYIIDRQSATNGLFSLKLMTGSVFGFQTRFDDGSGLGVVQGGPVTTGTWFHVAMVRDRTASLFRLYVNGAEVGTRADSGAALTAPPVRIGQHATTPLNSVNGVVDEFAMFSRALGPSEIAAMYRRGVMNVTVQARTCDDDACDGESFVGEGNNPLVSYSEAGNPNLGLPSLDLTGALDNRYIQYRMTLTSRDATLSPQIAAVQMGPSHRHAGLPAVAVATGVTYTNLTGFEAATSGNVTFQLSPDGLDWYFHDGNDWIAAGAPADANIAAQVDAALAGFAADHGPGDIFVRAILDSSSGTAAASVDSITLDYE